MKLEFDDGKLGAVAADALAVPVFKDEAPDAVGTLVEPLRDAGERKGMAGELTLLHSPNGFAARRLLLIGCGDDLLVSHRSTGLDDGSHSCFGGGVDTVPEGEEGVGRQHGTVQV